MTDTEYIYIYTMLEAEILAANEGRHKLAERHRFIFIHAGGSRMRKALGKWGEDIAADYLRQRGYRIITRNFRTRAGEIDIVCRRGRLLVFVEVKTRNGTAYGSPEESITLAKQRQIRQLALAYLENNKPTFGEVRFDVIGILISDGRPQINHLEAAF